MTDVSRDLFGAIVVLGQIPVVGWAQPSLIHLGDVSHELGLDTSRRADQPLQ